MKFITSAIMMVVSSSGLASGFQEPDAIAYAGAQAGAVAAVNSEQTTVISTPKEIEIKNVPGVGGVAMAPSAICHGTTSVGLSAVGFGFNIGSSWTDDDCRIMQSASTLYNMGLTVDAIAVMCQVEHVKIAPSCQK